MRETSTTLPATSRRRDFLTAAGFTALAGVAVVSIALPDQMAASTITTSSRDAELVAECERFLELERQIRSSREAVPYTEDVGIEAVFAAEDAAQEANEPAEIEQRAILARLHGLHARTLDGHRMRARVLFAYRSEIEEEGEPDGYLDQQMVWLLVRDLVGGTDHG